MTVVENKVRSSGNWDTIPSIFLGPLGLQFQGGQSGKSIWHERRCARGGVGNSRVWLSKRDGRRSQSSRPLLRTAACHTSSSRLPACNNASSFCTACTAATPRSTPTGGFVSNRGGAEWNQHMQKVCSDFCALKHACARRP